MTAWNFIDKYSIKFLELNLSRIKSISTYLVIPDISNYVLTNENQEENIYIYILSRSMRKP